MKSIYKVLPILIFLFTACDLDQQPDNRTELDSPMKVKKLLVSAYPISSPWYITEMMSDNTDENGGTLTAHSLFQTQAFKWQPMTDLQNDGVFYLWDKQYMAVAAANQALYALEQLQLTGAEIGLKNMDNGSQEELDGLRAEALLCRAFAHFILVNVFCQHYNYETSDTDLGIPYSTVPETELVVKHKRPSVAAVYEAIDKDIQEALPLLYDDIYDQPKYHFNRRAAYAFATRFYLYYRDKENKNLDKVIQYATEVLGSHPATELRDWKSLGRLNASNQYLRPNAYIATESKANILLTPATSLWARVHGPYAVGTKYTHNENIAKAETTSMEKSASGKAPLPWVDFLNQYVTPSSYASQRKVVMRKYAEYFEFTDPINGVGYPHLVQAVFTTDETLLYRAEAYVLKGDLDKALVDLSTFTNNFMYPREISKKRIIDYYSSIEYYHPIVATAKKELNVNFTMTSDQENFIHYILHLRRILTMHEGQRWYDIKRYGIEIYRRYIYGETISVTDKLEINDPRRAAQLPQEVIGAGLTPNPR